MTELSGAPDAGQSEGPERPTFGEYKKSGGEMEEDRFTAVETQRGDMEGGLEQIISLGIGLPTPEMAMTFSKIRAEHPDKSNQWVLTETYLYLGKG